jgi:hypothetical protein
METHDAWLAAVAANPLRPASRDEAAGEPAAPPDLYAGVTGKFAWARSDLKDTPADETYRIAGQYLSGKGLVEDWGCGTTYARQFVAAPYRGVDGAWSPWADEVVNLTEYRSSVPKILMRHVLEHNWEWRTVLENMLCSFTDRACLVLFLRPGVEDVNIYRNPREGHRHVPALSLCEADLHAIIAGHPEITMWREDIDSMIETRYERIYWLEK